ncbi:MAG: DMT family transporter [Alphaproteobacteria bacterium]|nr:DMT family transporter [Alphaproteobacteria bacterium]
MTANTNPPAALSANMRGMLWMALTAFVLTVTAALMKAAGQTLPLAEIVCIRMTIGALAAVPGMLRGGWAGMATQRLGGHFVRAVLGIGAFTLYTYAITNMLLANAMALAFTTPLWMIIVARVVRGEKAGWPRAIATLIGFLGIVIIARPDVEISLPAMAALTSAFLLSLAMLYVKSLSSTESPDKLAFYVQVFGAIFTAPVMLMNWQTPTGWEWTILLVAGVIGTFGLFGQAKAYSTGNPTAVAPVDFSRLPMAVLLGVLFFGELPDAVAFSGMAIVIGALLFISRRA